MSSNCFYEIRRQLTYKQAHYRTKVELVERWYPSSKTCSKCGHVQPKKLSERVFLCQNPDCGHILDRDENAAINLECAPNEKVRLA
ncbi:MULTISPECIES: zinc ribbon domain-containing protein [unclassified Microcoleus]|uniref:zinc ribbon domain-containing protein n=1 Tax=unclassified Microcoleus TaxID=2642155 RepID=UPI0040407068